MSKEILFGLALCAVLPVLAVPADAQSPARMVRIGYLDGSTSVTNAVFLESFRQELGKLGWSEGKNIQVEYRYADQKPARLPELAADLVRLNVELIVCASTPPVLATKRATTTIPIVMLRSGDPVATGLVAGLARPGGNVTGLAGLSPQLITKRLEILKETVPRLARAGVLMFRGGPGVSQELQLKEIEGAAAALQVKIVEIEIKIDPEGLDSAFRTAKKKQADALIPVASGPISNVRKRIGELAVKYRFPVIYSEDEFVEAGGLMSYGPDSDDLYRRGAHYVDKILRGTRPSDLPVEQPTKFELVINLKTAKQIGLTIPDSVLYRADRIIK